MFPQPDMTGENLSSEPKISGFTFVRDAVRLDYPIVESISSALPIVDEYIVNVGDCSDNTLEAIRGIGDSKIKILQTDWNPDRFVAGATNADQTNIALDQCETSYSGGRHGVQLNGRFKGVTISRLKSWHNQRTSLSLIGCQDVDVLDSEFWGNNDQGMVIYDYFDHSNFDPSDPEPFKACHHPTKNITVANCTIVVGYQRWKKDMWHYHTPVNKPAVLINTNLGELFPDFRPSNIVLRDNIFMTPYTNLIEYGHSYDASATKVYGNMCHAKVGEPEVRVTGKHTYDLAHLQSVAPSHYHTNTIEAPGFAQVPEYAYIDLVAQGPFNFAHHSSHAHLYSKKGFEDSKGAPVPHPKIHVGGTPVHGQAETSETPSLPWEEREPGPGDSGEGGGPFEP